MLKINLKKKKEESTMGVGRGKKRILKTFVPFLKNICYLAHLPNTGIKITSPDMLWALEKNHS